MIIDLILDRKNGQLYKADKFYCDVMEYAEFWPDEANPITHAMDEGNDDDVRSALCAYIDRQGYKPEIKDYINSMQWLDDDPTQERHNMATVATAAEENGETVKIGGFDTFADFLSYYRAHYRPILEQLQQDQISIKDIHTLRFFAGDMLSAFAEDDD